VGINIAPVQGVDDQLEWRDLLLEGGGSGRLKTGGFVAGRAVAMAYRGGTPAVRSPFDLQRARLVLEGRQQTEFAQLATAPTALAAMSEDIGITVCTYRDASGAARTVAELASSWAVLDVMRPTVEAPSLRQAASAMRPHAAYQVWRDEAAGGGEPQQVPARTELQARTRTVRVGR